jgi:NAD(P)-dependent dehydrogenase (short-subunit alcohol dehydrogenase family)
VKLDKKVAVVTGAGRGIGKAIANRFVEKGDPVLTVVTMVKNEAEDTL